MRMRAATPWIPSGVSERAFAQFLHVLTIDDDSGPTQGRPRQFNSISRSGGLGCFAISPLRLQDLGILKEVFVSKGKAIANPSDKRVKAFLSNPLLQRDAVLVSLKRYDATLSTPLPAGVTRSGALALHHRLGPKALVKWKQHQEPSTTALFQRANGLF